MKKDHLILLRRLMAIILIFSILMPLNPFVSFAQSNDRIEYENASNQILRKYKDTLELQSKGVTESSIDWTLTHVKGDGEINPSETVKVYITLSQGQILAPIDILKLDENILTIKAINRNYPEEEIVIFDFLNQPEINSPETDSIEGFNFNSELIDQSQNISHTFDYTEIEKYIIEFSNLNTTNTFNFSTIIENSETSTHEVFAELENDPTVYAVGSENLVVETEECLSCQDTGDAILEPEPIPIPDELVEKNISDLGTTDSLIEYIDGRPVIEETDTPIIEDNLLSSNETSSRAEAITQSGSGNFVNSKGSYNWNATISADGSSITWNVSMTNVREGLFSSSRNYFYFRNQYPLNPVTTQNFTATSTAGGINISESNGVIRIYDGAIRDAATMTVTFTTPLEPLTTVESYDLQFVIFVRPEGNNNYGPFDLFTGSAVDASNNLTPIMFTIANPAYSPSVAIYTVNKVDEQGNPLQGAEFTLSNGSETFTATSNQEGKANFNNILAGTYTLTETIAPVGYNGVAPSQVEVNMDNTSTTVVNTLIPTSTPIIVKATADGTTTPLAGVHFKLIQGTTEYTAGPTDATGNATFPDIPYGEYTLTQSITPAGYYAPADKTVTVSEAENSFTMESTTIPPQGNLNIQIRDHEDQTIPIIGAVVKVENDANGTVYERTTDSSGNISLADLPVGNYTITQESAPTGYTKYPNPIKVELKTGETQTVLFTNLNSDNPSGLGRIVVNSYEWPVGNTTPIPGAVYEVTNDLGQTWTGTTNANGYLVFTGLPVTGRTYTLRQVSVPYEYSNLPTPVVQGGITFQPLEFINIYDVYNSKRETIKLDVKVHETGDPSIPIVGAEIVVTRPADGATFTGITNSEGIVTFDLFDGDYLVNQTTTDATHLVTSVQDYPVDLQRYYLQILTNDLINPASATRSVTVNKVWGDPPPNDNTEVTFTMVADGVLTNTSQTQVIPAAGGSITFNNLPKYNNLHNQIQYSVQEEAITGYYPLYKKIKTDGSEWEVTNYAGEAVGNCTTGGYWVGSMSTAYLLDDNGKLTSKQIQLVGTVGHLGDLEAGGDIAITPDASIMYSVKRYNERTNTQYYPLVMYDVETGARLKEFNLGNLGWFSTGVNMDTINSLHTDGTYIYVKRMKGTEIQVYSVADTLTQPNMSTLQPAFTIYNSHWSAGDIIILDNGDILFSGLKDPRDDDGLWLHPKIGENQYGPAQYVGHVAVPADADGGFQGLAYYDVNGDGEKEVIVAVSSNTTGKSYSAYLNQDITTSPSYPSVRYTTTMLSYFDADNGGHFYPHGATASDGTGCSAIIKVSGSKTWIGDTPETRPESIVVTLQQSTDGTSWTDYSATDYENPRTINADANGNWTWLFEDLPKFNESGTPYKYRVVETPVPGYTTSVDGYNVTNTLQAGALHLQKYGATGEMVPIRGAGFTLFTDSTATTPYIPIQEMFTDSEGKITFVPLPIGTYYLKETTTPSGYQDSNKIYRVEVTENSVTVYDGNTLVGNNTLQSPLIVYNEPITYGFSIRKVDENGTIIYGDSDALKATFVLKQGTTTIATEQTELDGIVTFDGLAPGTYTLEETIAPQGYELINRIYTVVVSSSGAVTITYINESGATIPVSSNPLIVVNPKAGFDITLLKVNEDGTETLTGARFTLYKVGTDGITLTEVTNVPVGNDGKLNFVDLMPGDYAIEETVAPTGYQLDPTVYRFTLNNDGTVSVITTDGNLSFNNTSGELNFKNNPNIFKIKKVDSNSGITLEGALFELKKPNGDTIRTSTDENGVIIFENLSPGRYEVIEITPPTGYVLNGDKFIVEINDIGEVKVYKENEPTVLLGQDIDGIWTFEISNIKTYNIDLIKKDDSEIPNLLQGAKFKLTRTDVEPDEVYPELITGEDGKVVLENLPPGSYTLKEIEAPLGYILDERDYNFTIGNNGTITTEFPENGNLAYGKESNGNNQFTFTNKLSSFSIIKVDSEDNTETLSGAEFTLTPINPEGIPIVMTTNENGKLVFDNLKSGDYTLIETKAPDGYLLSDTLYYVSISTTGVVKITREDDAEWSLEGSELELEIENKKLLDIDLVKVDENHIPIDMFGAKFELSYIDPQTGVEKIEIIIINPGSNGRVTLTGLYTGVSYTLKEIKAPDGYLKDLGTHQFMINELGEVVIIETTEGILTVVEDPNLGFSLYFVNKPVLAKLQILKIDANEEPIVTTEGQPAVFELQQQNADGTYEVVYTAETDGMGMYFFNNIAVGEYRLIEVTAPTGYVSLAGETYTVTVSVSDDGTLPVLTILDKDDNLVKNITPLIIKNYKPEYPATGGIGTLPYFMLGAMLMAVAFIIGKKNLSGGDLSM